MYAPSEVNLKCLTHRSVKKFLVLQGSFLCVMRYRSGAKESRVDQGGENLKRKLRLESSYLAVKGDMSLSDSLGVSDVQTSR